jgi:hypothetical protein
MDHFILHPAFPHTGNPMEKERFKKLFPHLAEELDGNVSKVVIEVEGKSSRKWVGFIPDIVDFFRRCDTDEQGEEIIEYLEKKGEITQDRALELMKQLREKGIRSFGGKKGEGYYHRDR